MATSLCARTRRDLHAAWIVIALGAAVVANSGCESGGADGSAAGTRGASSGSSGGDDDSCVLRTTLSGGVNAAVGDVSQACVYSQRSVAFAPLDGTVVITLVVDDVERGQTGSFPARMDVRANDESWAGATCTVNIESNVKREPTGDAGGSHRFDQYDLEGTGSCSTPAVFRGDAAAREPVTIAPFTFASTTLFY